MIKVSSLIVMPGLHFHRDSTRREQECEWYICLVYDVLNLFLSHLEALGNMSVNRKQIKGHECLASFNFVS